MALIALALELELGLLLSTDNATTDNCLTAEVRGRVRVANSHPRLGVRGDCASLRVVHDGLQMVSTVSRIE